MTHAPRPIRQLLGLSPLCTPQLCAVALQPSLPRRKFEAESVVIHLQIAVAAERDCTGHDLAHLLRQHSHVSRVIVALVAEAIEADAAIEPGKRDDVLLET